MRQTWRGEVKKKHMPSPLNEVKIKLDQVLPTLENAGLVIKHHDGIAGIQDRPCSIITDSRLFSKGQIFLAIKGNHVDAHLHLLPIIEAQPALVIVENIDACPEEIKNARFIHVRNSRQAW